MCPLARGAQKKPGLDRVKTYIYKYVQRQKRKYQNIHNYIPLSGQNNTHSFNDGQVEEGIIQVEGKQKATNADSI